MFATLNVISVKIIDGNAPTTEFNRKRQEHLQKITKTAYEFSLKYVSNMTTKWDRNIFLVVDSTVHILKVMKAVQQKKLL